MTKKPRVGAMSKDPNGAADKRTLEDKVCDWLGKEGYRLEYLAYRAFADVGLAAALSTFVESEDGKQREIDAIGEFNDDFVSIRVVCECKYSHTPWVVLHSNLNNSFRQYWDWLPHSP